MGKVAQMKIAARIENLNIIRTFVAEYAREQRLNATRVSDIELSFEEACANICKYAYAGGPGEIEVNCFSDDGSIIIDIIDSGVSFDMTSVDDPDITSDISERSIGGLGIFLIRKLTDRVIYRREDDRNILRLIIFR